MSEGRLHGRPVDRSMGAKHNQIGTQHGLCAPSIMVYIHVICTHEYHFTSLFSSPTILTSLHSPKVSVWQYGSIIRIDLPAQQTHDSGSPWLQPFLFTALASYIVNTPEAATIACVAGKTSHLTMANYRPFGDPTHHKPWTASTTLAQLTALATRHDPLDLPTYLPAAKAIRLDGVHLPSWRDWYLKSPTRILLSDPSQFLTPEPLHHWHKQFWDHDTKWAIRAVGADKFDFWFATIQPITSFKQFKDGVSKLKQVTGRGHHDVERYIVCVIAGKAPPLFVITIRALMDFCYLAQSRQLNDCQLTRITASLQLFHKYKQSILDASAHVGKGNKPIDHFQIPKLEFLHSVVPSVTACGVVMQWSADTTEDAHITEIKVPGRSGNNRSYNPQICRWLDRSKKHRNFSLAVSIHELQFQAYDTNVEDQYDDDLDNTAPNADADNDNEDNQSNLPGWNSPRPDLFSHAPWLPTNITPTTPLPLRTLCTDTTAFQLNYCPSLPSLTVDEAAITFKLPDHQENLESECVLSVRFDR